MGFRKQKQGILCSNDFFNRKRADFIEIYA
jgi:hypothetical protein